MSKNTLLKIHKVLGLSTGLVVLIVSLTGCLWVFKQEIEGLYITYKKVAPQSIPMITASHAKDIAQKAIPNRHVHGTLFGKSDEALEVIFYEADPEFYQSVFLNPYSGEILHIENHKAGFFGFILDGHVNLWLPHQVGSSIVSFSVLFFLIILVSGIVLWWPKGKKIGAKNFKLNWNSRTKWKRKNYDLHSIVGFYVSSLAFILAFTGCVMAFNWFYFIFYVSIGGAKAPQFIIPNSIDKIEAIADSKTLPMDKLIPLLREEYPNAKNFELHYPETDSSSIYVEISHSKSINYDADYLFFDQYTLKELETPSIYGKYKNTMGADKIIRMNYDIHIGAIGGLVGKIIAFLISLSICALPITGFIIWYNKKR